MILPVTSATISMNCMAFEGSSASKRWKDVLLSTMGVEVDVALPSEAISVMTAAGGTARGGLFIPPISWGLRRSWPD